MENWFNQMYDTGNYDSGGIPNSDQGTGALYRGNMPADNQASDDLSRIRDYRAGFSNRGPEAQQFGVDKLYKKRNAYNNWFQTPGMTDAGANMYAGPGQGI